MSIADTIFLLLPRWRILQRGRPPDLTRTLEPLRWPECPWARPNILSEFEMDQPERPGPPGPGGGFRCGGRPRLVANAARCPPGRVLSSAGEMAGMAESQGRALVAPRLGSLAPAAMVGDRNECW